MNIYTWLIKHYIYIHIQIGDYAQMYNYRRIGRPSVTKPDFEEIHDIMD